MIQEDYNNEIKKDPVYFNNEYNNVIDKISKSTAIYNGKPIDTLFMPKFFSQQQIKSFDKLTTTMLSIIDKVIKHYLEDEDYRRLFPFSEELNDLIVKDHGYDCLLPMARIDIFYNEETGQFKFCEINTDGTSAMNEDRELVRIFNETSILNKIKETYSINSFELIESWNRELINIFRSSRFYNNNENPTIGIVDFLDKATLDEFRVFKKCFEKNGYKTLIADIRNIDFKNNIVSYEGKKIDIIYRRAVTTEILKHFHEVTGFLEACASEQICIIGSMKTQIVHHKSIFKILHMDQSHKILSDEEIAFIKEHIPFTEDLTEENSKKIIENKDKYIIKPLDQYGSKGVYAGLDFSMGLWKQKIEEAVEKGYLVQDYCIPYESEFPVFTNDRVLFQKFNNITGIYLYNGKMMGILSRAGQKAVISGINKGVTLPTYMIKKS